MKRLVVFGYIAMMIASCSNEQRDLIACKKFDFQQEKGSSLLLQLQTMQKDILDGEEGIEKKIDFFLLAEMLFYSGHLSFGSYVEMIRPFYEEGKYQKSFYYQKNNITVFVKKLRNKLGLKLTSLSRGCIEHPKNGEVELFIAFESVHIRRLLKAVFFIEKDRIQFKGYHRI